MSLIAFYTSPSDLDYVVLRRADAGDDHVRAMGGRDGDLLVGPFHPSATADRADARHLVQVIQARLDRLETLEYELAEARRELAEERGAEPT